MYALIILTETDRHAIMQTMCSLTFLRFETTETRRKKERKRTEIHTQSKESKGRMRIFWRDQKRAIQ